MFPRKNEQSSKIINTKSERKKDTFPRGEKREEYISESLVEHLRARKLSMW